MYNYNYMQGCSCTFLVLTLLILTAWWWPLYISETCSCYHDGYNKSCELSVAFPSLWILRVQRKWRTLNLNNAIFAETSPFICHTDSCIRTRARAHTHTDTHTHTHAHTNKHNQYTLVLRSYSIIQNSWQQYLWLQNLPQDTCEYSTSSYLIKYL